MNSQDNMLPPEVSNLFYDFIAGPEKYNIAEAQGKTNKQTKKPTVIEVPTNTACKLRQEMGRMGSGYQSRWA